jgi:hypothetical protein
MKTYLLREPKTVEPQSARRAPRSRPVTTAVTARRKGVLSIEHSSVFILRFLSLPPPQGAPNPRSPGAFLTRHNHINAAARAAHNLLLLPPPNQARVAAARRFEVRPFPNAPTPSQPSGHSEAHLARLSCQYQEL